MIKTSNTFEGTCKNETVISDLLKTKIVHKKIIKKLDPSL